MERTAGRRGITAVTGLKEVLDRVPTAGLILLQQGRMFQARTGELSASYPGLTVAEYAALNGIVLAPLIRLLDAAAETDGCGLAPGRNPGRDGHGPHRVVGGTSAGYTGAYREPSGLDLEDVVSVQSARGPE